jgi:hypothetical protein
MVDAGADDYRACRVPKRRTCRRAVVIGGRQWSGMIAAVSCGCCI